MPAESKTPSASTNPKGQVSKELRAKANDFLNSRKNANNLVDIIAHLSKSAELKQPLTPAILTLEVIFTELFKRREICKNPKFENAEAKYQKWLLERYEESWTAILSYIEYERLNDAQQALVTAMKLLSAESKYPIQSKDEVFFPKQRLIGILRKLASPNKSQTAVIQRFKEYADYLDVVVQCWRQMLSLATSAPFENEIFACNYLELLQALPVTKSVQEEKKLLFSAEETSENLDYAGTRRNINKVWNCVQKLGDGMKETVHKQMLIVLLERILPHLDKPILLTDFLMDSLDCGGAVSLLALQGIFTLIQKHNITYPNIYEKLYSMFEVSIFYTKFKARLFYLADIFLSSTHLPEALVAAFVKRLARLSLVAPPQDIIIILNFIGNLLLRHPGLKRLISATSATEMECDPFQMDELDPTKSRALESSMWEILLLQKHALPSVATAAKFISRPLPTQEWDLSSVLDSKDEDLFEQEARIKAKQFALEFERPTSMFLVKNDQVQKHFKLF